MASTYSLPSTSQVVAKAFDHSKGLREEPLEFQMSSLSRNHTVSLPIWRNELAKFMDGDAMITALCKHDLFTQCMHPSGHSHGHTKISDEIKLDKTIARHWCM